MDLTTPIIKVHRVGRATAGKLKALGITTVADLLFYFPFRYDDFSRTTPIAELAPGSRANVVGQIELINNKRSRRRRLMITEALISDVSGMVKVVWFNQPFLTQNLQAGEIISLAGKVDDEFGVPVLLSPTYEKAGGRNLHTQGLVPYYSLTANLTQKQLRFLLGEVIDLAPLITDWLPPEIKKHYGLFDLAQAVRQSHFPRNPAAAAAAKQRLAFDELFLIQLQSQIIRRELRQTPARPLVFNKGLTKKFVQDLPFALTDDQRRAAWEIIQDLGQTKPMTRLLEGDVGSGKTVVALLAIINAVANQTQSALMVPTEILASQHFASLGRLVAKSQMKIALLTRSRCQLSGAAKIKRPELIKKIAAGEVDLVIGTHALIQEAVSFKNLALVIVDEQHRFGVAQRQALTQKTVGHELAPHLLSMTATPIPRSLALALYDDLALSIIKQMPKNRLPIITKIFDESTRSQAYEFIREQIKAGRQAFVICPLIDISDKLGAKAVRLEYNKLSEEIFSEFNIGMLHGRLKSADKEKVMQDFVNNKINILVATSVVEVGIDVPNATVMLVESADRFGLAQLHQYRGRVGRSHHQSYCFLLAGEVRDKARSRLGAMLEFDNGFALAKADLQWRGPGEVYGTLQKGFPELKVASLFDFALMRQAREAALKTLAVSPDLAKFKSLKDKLGETEKSVHLE